MTILGKSIILTPSIFKSFFRFILFANAFNNGLNALELPLMLTNFKKLRIFKECQEMSA